MRFHALTKSLALTLAAGSLALTGCHRAEPSSEGSDTTAITNRPQSYDRFIAVLKLKTPALLATATKVNGRPVVDQAQKAAVLAEQAQALADLQALSPDVKVLYSYKMVLNGLAVIAPIALEEKFRNLSAVSYVERDDRFERLAPVSITDTATDEPSDLATHNSVAFIGGLRVANELKVPGPDGTMLPVTGKGVRVGIIDTGIDYTHKMFDGAGTEAAYKAVNPDLVENNEFPTSRVVGGTDLVGTAYDNNSPSFDQHVPKPDANPIDEAGHGSHVAGTIAGHGDNINSYNGVAPDASLYAIKVFGKEGSTGDAVVIEALEFAADPNADQDATDQLDVVNMSLGSPFGSPHILYTEAVHNLVSGGTAVVASAGNSGDNAYIVGAPSTSPDAISVAATIDDMDHNYKFGAVAFKTPTNPRILAEAIEAAFAKPIAAAGNVTGKLVAIGLADTDLTPAQVAALTGNVALIDRGGVPFFDKVRRALAGGAIGAVVANNVEGDAFAMGGGDSTLDIPAIMITKTLGDALKAEMANNAEADIQFLTDDKIEKPQLIDTLTSFSSRGPRSVDGLIKPEIAAPGANVISAKMGAGDKSVQMSGTSMAAPHITGVVALLKQLRTDLDNTGIKSILVNTAKPISDAMGHPYDVAYMGAGRVQAFDAAKAALTVAPATLSLGEVLVETGKIVKQSLTLTNASDQAETLTLTAAVKAGLTLALPETLTLAAHESKDIEIKATIAPVASPDASQELDGFVTVSDGTSSYRIPVLAVVNRTSRIEAKSLVVQATSPADAAGSVSELTLQNAGKTAGDALAFNLLGNDDRKVEARENDARNAVCDLESVGWRVIKKTVDGQTLDLLQVAAKLYNPLTSWHLCEISILIDGNGDGIADQELLGTYLQTLTDNAAQAETFASVLTDANKMRSIRHDFELTFPQISTPVYTDAVLDQQDFLNYGHSTIAVVTADLSKLAKTPQGDLKIKVAALADTLSPAADDYLGDSDKWRTLTPNASGQAYVDLPETTSLAAGASTTLSFTKGGAKGDLIVYFPHNASTASPVLRDRQARIVKPRFGF